MNLHTIMEGMKKPVLEAEPVTTTGLRVIHWSDDGVVALCGEPRNGRPPISGGPEGITCPLCLRMWDLLALCEEMG